MADREKVIKVLECCLKESDHLYSNPCNGCPYEGQECIDRMKADALALLKEQDAVEPKQVDLYGKDEWWGLVCVCPDCKAEWMSDKADTHFCPKCGQAVKWE